MTLTVPEHLIFIAWLMLHSMCAMPIGALAIYLATVKAMPKAQERAKNKRLEALLKAKGGPEA